MSRAIVAEQDRRLIFAPGKIAIGKDSWNHNFVDILTQNILCDVWRTCDLDLEIYLITDPRIKNLKHGTIC
jgi:hypothetical protein